MSIVFSSITAPTGLGCATRHLGPSVPHGVFHAPRRLSRVLPSRHQLRYEYNDVRINRFSLSLLRVWGRPLPEVLKSEIMDPIGASATWVYHGYAHSDVLVDGKQMKSVSGGTRWGGGLWINTRDQARFGYLMLRGGKWQDRQDRLELRGPGGSAEPSSVGVLRWGPDDDRFEYLDTAWLRTVIRHNWMHR